MDEDVTSTGVPLRRFLGRRGKTTSLALIVAMGLYLCLTQRRQVGSVRTAVKTAALVEVTSGPQTLMGPVEASANATIHSVADLATTESSKIIGGTSDGNKRKKKTRVFLLMGQSNMVGFGKVSDAAKKRYPFFVMRNPKTNKTTWKRDLHDDRTTQANETRLGETKTNGVTDDSFGEVESVRFRRRVRYVFASGSEPESKSRIERNMWLSMKNQKTVGPEIGIGYELGIADTGNDDDILLLKSCVGNRGLGWDLLPPGSPTFSVEQGQDDKNATGWHYAGYKQYPRRWKIGETGNSIDDQVPGDSHNSTQNAAKNMWYGGAQYDGDVARAKSVLTNLSQYMGYDDPEDEIIFGIRTEHEYEISGFFFWQGDRDTYHSDPVYAERYAANLERFVVSLKRDFNAPRAKFVLATLGQIPNRTSIATAKTATDGKTRDGSRENATGQSPQIDEKKKTKKQKDMEAALRIEKQERLVFEAQMNLPERPGFVGNTACVYTYPYCVHDEAKKDDSSKKSSVQPSSTNHYKGKLDIFVKVGCAMGRAMLELLAQSDNDG